MSTSICHYFVVQTGPDRVGSSLLHMALARVATMSLEGPKCPESHDQQLVLNLGLLALLDLPAERPGDSVEKACGSKFLTFHGLLRPLCCYLGFFTACWSF